VNLQWLPTPVKTTPLSRNKTLIRSLIFEKLAKPAADGRVSTRGQRAFLVKPGRLQRTVRTLPESWLTRWPCRYRRSDNWRGFGRNPRLEIKKYP